MPIAKINEILVVTEEHKKKFTPLEQNIKFGTGSSKNEFKIFFIIIVININFINNDLICDRRSRLPLPYLRHIIAKVAYLHERGGLIIL